MLKVNVLCIIFVQVNMSPNLSSEHFAGNKLLYEQVVFSLLRLVGIAAAVRMDKSVIGSVNTFDSKLENANLICSDY